MAKKKVVIEEVERAMLCSQDMLFAAAMSLTPLELDDAIGEGDYYANLVSYTYRYKLGIDCPSHDVTTEERQIVKNATFATRYTHNPPAK